MRAIASLLAAREQIAQVHDHLVPAGTPAAAHRRQALDVFEGLGRVLTQAAPVHKTDLTPHMKAVHTLPGAQAAHALLLHALEDLP